MTMRPPRVLYLAPPLLKPGQITRYTFVSEEILGLTESGITSYVLSTAISKPYLQDGVRMVPVPPGKKVAEVLRTLSFLLRHWNTLPQGLLANFRKLYHKVRIERVAADLVRREGIDLIHSNFCYPGGWAVRWPAGRAVCRW